jgi:hypothetical protein
MMSIKIGQYCYTVVDRQNNLVLSCCPTPSMANAISNGFLNSAVMVIPLDTLNSEIDLSNYGKDPKLTFKIVRYFKDVPPRTTEVNIAEPRQSYPDSPLYDLVNFDEFSESWVEKRKLANKRLNLVNYLEKAIERYTIKFREFAQDDLFYLSFLKESIGPQSDSIKEYALISGISEEESFKHLKNKFESMTISIIRAKALWEKYVSYINKIDINESVPRIKHLIEVELLGGSRKIDG